MLLAPCAQAQTIAPTSPAPECLAIPAQSRQDLEPWLAGSAFAGALRFYVRGMYPNAAGQFAAAWEKVAGELRKAFATPECEYESVNAVLDRRVFKAPPDAIPMDEEFGMPVVVTLAAADAGCRAGDSAAAMNYLRPAADSGNPVALAALVVLESVKSPGTAVARIAGGQAANEKVVVLAGCLASIRAGNRNADWCNTAGRVQDDRQAMAIVELIRSSDSAGK